MKEFKKTSHELSSARHTIKCIKAVNRGKNEAIDALCEPVSEKEAIKLERMNLN
jgi:hypothetical protein